MMGDTVFPSDQRCKSILRFPKLPPQAHMRATSGFFASLFSSFFANYAGFHDHVSLTSPGARSSVSNFHRNGLCSTVATYSVAHFLVMMPVSPLNSIGSGRLGGVGPGAGGLGSGCGAGAGGIGSVCGAGFAFGCTAFGFFFTTFGFFFATFGVRGFCAGGAGVAFGFTAFGFFPTTFGFFLKPRSASGGEARGMASLARKQFL